MCEDLAHCAEHHGWDQFLQIWACENLEGPAIAHLPTLVRAGLSCGYSRSGLSEPP